MNQQNNDNTVLINKTDFENFIYYFIYHQDKLSFKSSSLLFKIILDVKLKNKGNKYIKNIKSVVSEIIKDKNINNNNLVGNIIKVFYNEGKYSNSLTIPITISIEINNKEINENSRLFIIKARGYSKSDINLEKIYDKLNKQELNKQNFILENYFIECYENIHNIKNNKLIIDLPKNSLKIDSWYWIFQIVIITVNENNITYYRSKQFTTMTKKETFIRDNGKKSYIYKLYKKVKEVQKVKKVQKNEIAKCELYYYSNSIYEGNDFKSKVELNLELEKVTENNENVKNSLSSNISLKNEKHLKKEINNKKEIIIKKNKSNKRKNNECPNVLESDNPAKKILSSLLGLVQQKPSPLVDVQLVLRNLSNLANPKNNPLMSYNQVNVNTSLLRFPLQHISPNLLYNNNLTLYPNIENVFKLASQSNYLNKTNSNYFNKKILFNQNNNR
ncbi:hypothetical protein H8356DRAFT_943577 [Neocallimastix lanati (nom. inval.)]|uniref:Uncharacterized protein n=1 Tax=Neocallimastix californiae TaxID=1754190 RepID=A0A1Y2ANJ9_9FUNG|nr:hypothetical protein H8356DRAFT_943577 [Neocallimastix sp. JGI-2020a]ORY24153.1 hypothetical protein LY90DRAFT_630579 [Neocallimastix californiae]|eukprot:ORY24153.1 hypothetical protein LY90DRAFT_630579 [Neocallimastix californiae]